MKITIHITKEVLEKTKTCSPKTGFVTANCAISYAVREIFPEALTSPVLNHPLKAWKITNLENTFNIPIPESAAEYAMRFDMTPESKRPSLPEFSFEIDVPTSVIEKIGIGEVYKILSESKTLTLTSI